jgi:hypothetical protein
VDTVEDDQPGTEDYGDCIRAWSDYVIWSPCGEGGLLGDEWILVPTGGSYALESAWYWDNEGVNDYMTADGLSAGSDIYDVPATGTENYRTWYWPSEVVESPVAPSPGPSASPVASPTPSTSASTAAYVRGERAGLILAA